MALITVDASVAIAWLVPEREPKVLAERAALLWNGVRTGKHQVRQPPHWLAEVAGVLARVTPTTASEDVRDLLALELAVLDADPVYLTACELSIALDHHLFDTLYHAVALELDAILVTADERYFRKARGQGRIVRLGEFGV